MNFIRSDYLKEVAVSAVFFGCMKTTKKRKIANRTSAGAFWRTSPGRGGKWHVPCVSRDDGLMVRLTVGHKVYSCDHRTAERDGTERIIIILKPKEGDPWTEKFWPSSCQQSWRLLPLRGRSNAWKQGRPSVWTCAPSSSLSCDPAWTNKWSGGRYCGWSGRSELAGIETCFKNPFTCLSKQPCFTMFPLNSSFTSTSSSLE